MQSSTETIDNNHSPDLSIPYHLENYIGGNLIGPLSGRFIDGVNPATGAVFCQVPDSGEKDVDIAVHAAQKAFPSWSTTPVEERFLVLNRIATLIDEHRDELALAETTDNGKPLWLSKKVDIPRASANFRFFATGIMHFATESHNMTDKAVNYTLRQPLGIVACISPWNLPLYLFTWKIAQRFPSAFAADATVFGAAKGRSQITKQPAVHPDDAGFYFCCHAVGF